ncbi:lasso peptide biosynthesis PqqD family chaperone [Bacillus dakarensis]|uniref:lasso peptide biosynthesis PqqD family chaperone n=1 Tax=Robertmurraya dakarensis TaxID=1926278 RepID=UPI000981210D|nr:lasso peptide biosynthesis PqqD family chaperone [Bacillus dakarensis]
MLTNTKLSLETTVKQVKGNIATDMGGETVMLSISNGKYYNLGEIGGAIWDLIETPIVVNDIVKALMENYEVGKKECEEEVLSFLNHLYTEGLIQFS